MRIGHKNGGQKNLTISMNNLRNLKKMISKNAWLFERLFKINVKVTLSGYHIMVMYSD